ncbi:MAG: hypothetical protein AAB263_18975, partial [Planctomycetota bacterium]
MSLSSTYSHFVRDERSERVEAWTGDRPAQLPTQRPMDTWRPAEPLADGGLTQFLEQAAKNKHAQASQDEPQLDPELENILILLERLFGAKGARAAALRLKSVQSDLQRVHASSVNGPALSAPSSSAPTHAGWGLIAESHQRLTDIQSASLVADGTFTLDDGSSFTFHLDWTQTITRVEESHTRIALGDAQLSDPISLDLTGGGFGFLPGSSTLDLHGLPSLIPRPKPGNALLVNDANGDDKLDGSELLGAKTGQAFRELAGHDQNRNGWIDAGDPAFGSLRLWDGVRGLTTLQQAGIAALITHGRSPDTPAAAIQ